jgi:ABC-type branched-subunit amino acid transport system ATPase component
MTVLENVLLAYKGQIGEGVFGALFRGGRISKQEKVNLKKALSILELLGLRNSRNEYAGDLSGGQQRLLSLSRILASGPELILLDEPTAGINLTLVTELLKLIKHFQVEESKTFLIVEHNMRVISEICDMVCVLVSGKDIACGESEKIQKDERVLKAYLGAVQGDSKEDLE